MRYLGVVREIFEKKKKKTFLSFSAVFTGFFFMGKSATSICRLFEGHLSSGEKSSQRNGDNVTEGHASEIPFFSLVV